MVIYKWSNQGQMTEPQAVLSTAVGHFEVVLIAAATFAI